MKILFVSRAFPPIIGGIEKQNAEVAEFLGKITPLTLVANTKGKNFLPFFLPLALLKILVSGRKHDCILLGDGVLAPLGAIAKFFMPRLTVVSIVHGLDITFAEKSSFLAKLYALINIPSLKKLDGLIAVSQDTKKHAVAIGALESRCFVIPNGIRPDVAKAPKYTRHDLDQLLGIDTAQKSILLTAGRLVRRKGVRWFIEEVIPRLPSQIIYLVAGAGPERRMIEETITSKQLTDRVKLLGRVPDETLCLLLTTVDVFVQPNIKVPGDMEGFGIAVIEAATSRRPVVAAKLEGLEEAISDQQNGLFAESQNATDFAMKINWLLADNERRQAFGEKARAYTLEHYSWEHLSQKYFDTLKTLSVNSSHS